MGNGAEAERRRKRFQQRGLSLPNREQAFFAKKRTKEQDILLFFCMLVTAPKTAARYPSFFFFFFKKFKQEEHSPFFSSFFPLFLIFLFCFVGLFCFLYFVLFVKKQSNYDLFVQINQRGGCSLHRLSRVFTLPEEEKEGEGEEGGGRGSGGASESYSFLFFRLCQGFFNNLPPPCVLFLK